MCIYGFIHHAGTYVYVCLRIALCLSMVSLIEQTSSLLRQLPIFTSVINLCLSIIIHQIIPDVSGSGLISVCKHSCFQVLNRTTLKLLNYSFDKNCVFRDRSYLTEPEYSFTEYVLFMRKQDCMKTDLV